MLGNGGYRCYWQNGSVGTQLVWEASRIPRATLTGTSKLLEKGPQKAEELEWTQAECLPVRTQLGCPELDVDTGLLGGFRTCLLVTCICSLWGSTITQMFCFLWMETLGLHSQDG